MKRIALSIGFALLAIGAQAADPPARATDFDNVHIRVPDPDKAAAWYVKVLGASPAEPPVAGTAQVTFGSTVITITKGESQPSLNTLIDHIGLSFKDIDAAIKTAAAGGAKVTQEVRMAPGIFRYAYIEDPWGVRIEFVEDPDRIGFHQVHLRVKDPAATLSWYHQQFGGERTMLRGKVDGVRINGVWIFAMPSGADTPAPPTAIQLVAFRVPDVDRALKNLTAAGVKLLNEPRELPALRYAFVEDPNGIRVEVVKRPAK
jgi:catechol 2,3-dioxygenase-like lactoylglutathione lyase family enzyme